MDKLRAMQIFSRVVEARSFAGAANILAVPRSTISRAIQELEASLGVRLLQRTTRTLHVTPNGSLYYDHCQRILYFAGVREQSAAGKASIEAAESRQRDYERPS